MFRLRCHNFESTKPASWINQRQRYRLGRFWVQFLGRYLSLAYWLSAQTIGAEGLGLDSRAGQIGTVSQTARQCCDVSVFPSRRVAEMTPSGVCKGEGRESPPLTIAEKINCKKSRSFLKYGVSAVAMTAHKFFF